MRVLVTGGAGYLGSNLVDRLLAEGYEVSLIDNLSTGNIANIAHCLDRVRFVHGSILDCETLEREIERVDLVFHLAAAVGVRNIVNAPLEGLLVNAAGTENVLSLCSKYWKRVLIASTSEVYGKSAKIPMCEDDDRVLGSTKVHRWGYSTAKALDEHLAFAHADQGLPVSIVRYFNSYGPRVDAGGYGSVIASFLAAATSGRPIVIHGDGTQTRSFTFVDDTVAGTFLAGTLPEAIGTVVNLGSPVENTIIELAEMIQDLVGVNTPIEKISYEAAYGKGFEDTARRVPDVSRAKEVLGWEPKVELSDGLARTYAWWKQVHG